MSPNHPKKLEEKEKRNQDKAQFFPLKNHTFSHTSTNYNKRRLYSPKGYTNQKRAIIMKAIA